MRSHLSSVILACTAVVSIGLMWLLSELLGVAFFKARSYGDLVMVGQAVINVGLIMLDYGRRLGPKLVLQVLTLCLGYLLLVRFLDPVAAASLEPFILGGIGLTVWWWIHAARQDRPPTHLR